MSTELIDRRKSIPILYTKGTHYEVGYDVGRTFSGLICDHFNTSASFKEMLTVYSTPEGKSVYDETLEVVQKRYPQYIRELEGVADGARVPFCKVFLLQLDDILVGNEEAPPTGCTSMYVNNPNIFSMSHTEDALTEVLNSYYFVSMHIIPDDPNLKEEKFTSLCYPGCLPGYTMNYNQHGLVFTINTIFVKQPQSGKTPRMFITRALLSAENYAQAVEIIKDTGAGVGNACSINMTFLSEGETRIFRNIEIGPGEKSNTCFDVVEIPTECFFYHCNSFQHLSMTESGLVNNSNKERLCVLKKCSPPKSIKDIENIMGDTSGETHKIFRDKDHFVSTIAVGIFDLNKKLGVYMQIILRLHHQQWFYTWI